MAGLGSQRVKVSIMNAKDDRGWLHSEQRQEIFLFTIASRLAVGPTKISIQWAPAGILSSVIKKPGHEAEYSPPPSSGFKYVWSYTYTPPCLHGILLN
jgi:hypothetical protein